MGSRGCTASCRRPEAGEQEKGDKRSQEHEEDTVGVKEQLERAGSGCAKVLLKRGVEVKDR